MAWISLLDLLDKLRQSRPAKWHNKSDMGKISLIIATWRDDDARRARGEDVSTTQDRDIAGLTRFYNMCNWRFEAIRITLIPRVLQLSEDKDVFNALLKYETRIEEFEDVMRQPMGRAINRNVIEGLTRLIESSASVYEAIRKKMPNLQELERLMEESGVQR